MLKTEDMRLDTTFKTLFNEYCLMNIVNLFGQTGRKEDAAQEYSVFHTPK